MGALADVFLRGRMDTSQLKGDAEKGLTGANLGKLGETHGKVLASGFSGGFRSIVTSAAGIVGILGVTGIAGAAVKMGITTAAAMQQAQVGFTTLLGSGQKAKDFLSQLSSFAAATPFELKGLVDSSRLLLGVGVDSQKVIPLLTAFGDAAGAVGVGQEQFQRIMLATSQAISAGKFQAQDMNQITENGIPIWKLLAEATGKPVPELRKMSEQGKLLASDVLPALQKQMEKDYGGAMARQSQTLNGVWSTLKDTVSIGLSNALQPLVPMLSALIPRAADVAGKAFTVLTTGLSAFFTGLRGGAVTNGSQFAVVMGQIGGAARDVGQIVTAYVLPALREMGPVLLSLVGGIASLVGWFRQHMAVTLTLVGVLGSLAAIYFVTSAALAIQSGGLIAYLGLTNAVRIATVIWTGVQWLFNAAMDASVIGLVVLAVAALVAGIIVAIKYHKQIADFIVNTWNTVWAWSARLVKTIVDYIVNQWNSFWQGTVQVYTQVVNFIVGVWQSVASAVYTFLKPAIDVATSVWSVMWSIIKLAAQVGWAIIQIVFALIRIEINGLVALWRDFQAVWSVVWSAVTNAAKAAWDWLIANVWNPFYNTVVVRLKNAFHDFVVGLQLEWDFIRNLLKAGWDWIVNNIWNPFYNTVVVRIKNAFHDFVVGIQLEWNFFKNILKAGWDWIVNNVFNPIHGFITSTIPDWFNKGVSAIGRFWDGLRELAAKPVRFFIDTIIDDGIVGALNWVTNKLGINNAHIDPIHPAGLAEGGIISGPGTGTSDSIWATVAESGQMLKVSNGEFVVPAKKVAEVGVGNLYRWIGTPGATYPGDGSGGIAFAGGGVIGELSSLASSVFNLFTDPAKLFANAARRVVGTIPGSGAFRAMLTGAGGKAVGWAETWLANKVKTLASSLLGGTSGAFAPGAVGNVAAAQAFLRAQVGKPYGWAHAGPGSYDCSGIVSAIWNVLHGKNPYQHTFSTQNEAPYFPLRGLGGILSAAWTNPGEHGVGSDVGHTMGILNGMPFESTGSRGVHMGSGVTAPGRFAHTGHLASGGLVGVYDRGGPWPTGTLGINTSGRTEHVSTGRSMDAVVDRLEQLIAEVRKIAPGVGSEINRTGRGMLTIARAH
jgi:tape measure domain-containing protein